jgi:hypothetical protein
LRSADITRAATGATSMPEPSRRMTKLFRTIRSYILWQHERGTLHYDIMVTLILMFIFFSPRAINFNDKPAPSKPHPTGVVVSSDGAGSLVYQIDAATMAGGDDAALREQLLGMIRPISGDVSIERYERVSDSKGQGQEYRVWVKRKQ